jgi:hypothetical protein
LTVTFGDYPFYPKYPERDLIETDKPAFWEIIAQQALEFFIHKDDFMEWVCSHYFLDENRVVADMSWNLVKWIQDNPEMDCG